MNKKELLQELREEGFSDSIIKAFEKVKREDFVPEHLKSYAYRNEPLPIALGSTISQPYTIAFMLNLLELDKLKNKIINKDKKLLTNNYNKLVIDNISNSKQDKLGKSSQEGERNSTPLSNINNIKILEIGSGSGYVLALTSEILKNILKIKNYEIYGVEVIDELVEKSKKVLKKEIKNKKIHVVRGDGSKGLSEKSPFDRILVSAAFEKIPEKLFSQLKNNGILVTPVRNSIFQFKKQDGKIKSKEFPGFVFVPVVEEN